MLAGGHLIEIMIHRLFAERESADRRHYERLLKIAKCKSKVEK